MKNNDHNNTEELLNTPFFSIIIPTYNRAFCIKTAINSVLKQEYSLWELIIIDDASTDDTSEVVKPFLNERIKYYLNTVNKERSFSRNRGIEISKGEFICFLDSDDEFEVDHLSKIYNFIKSNNNQTAMYYTGYKIGSSGKEIFSNTIESNNYSNDLQFILMNDIGIGGSCYHKPILNKYKFDLSLNFNEDVELNIRIINEYPLFKAHLMTYKVVNYPEENNMQYQLKRIRKIISTKKNIFKYKFVKEKFSSSLINHKLASHYRDIIDLYFYNKNYLQLYKWLFFYLFSFPQEILTKKGFLFIILRLPLIKRIQLSIKSHTRVL